MTLNYAYLNEIIGDRQKKYVQTAPVKKDIIEKMTDYGTSDECYYSKYKINMKSCDNKNNKVCEGFTDYCPSEIKMQQYEIPLDEKSKKSYDNAVSTSLNAVNSNNISYDEFNKNSNYNNVKPYEYDDMDQYLSLNNFKNEIVYDSKKEESKEQTNIISSLIEQPLTINDNTNNNFSLLNNDAERRLLNENENGNNDFLTNILIFIFIGIILLLMCHLLVKLAINIGMKKAIQAVEPYLTKYNIY